ncbi:MAG: DUF4197 domain-containing protein [Nevskia sp.]
MKALPWILVISAAAALVAPAEAGKFSDFAKQVMQQPGASGALSDSDIGAGLKEALAQGTKNAVNQLGRSDGFWNSERFRIPLPGPLAQADTLLRQFGAGPKLDELHLSMNRAAEKAVPVAADVFSGAVRKLTLADVRGILGGAPDAATQYFRKTTSDTLIAKFKPIVAGITARAGLAQQYKAVLGSAGPLASSLGAPDLDRYVAQKALDGLFLRVADEEKNIRENPAARTTELLKKVFAQ